MTDVATPPEPDFVVGGVEELFLPGGVPVEVAEQAAADKAEHDAQYYADYYAAMAADVPPEIPPAPEEVSPEETSSGG